MASVSDYILHGFDISHYQSDIFDFTQNGRVFAIMKASDGATYVDPEFASHRSQAHAQNMAAVGFYHFARPGSNSASVEATHFLNTLGQRKSNEFAVLDYEINPWDEVWAVEFLTIVKAAGWPVVFYTYRAMLMSKPHNNIRATGAALWVAAYSSSVPSTDWPWTFWQHTNGQDSVSGDDGPCDCSVFHTNNLNDLVAFVGGETQEEEMAYAVTYEGSQGIWSTDGVIKVGFANPDELAAAKAAGIVGETKVLPKSFVDRLVDAPHLQDLAQWIGDHIGDGGGGSGLSDADVARVAKAVADLLAKRLVE